MGTIIDSLLVTVGLDPANFQVGKKKVDDGLKDTGDKAESNRKRHEAEAKKVGEAYSKIRNEVLALTAALVGAVAGKQFLESLTRSDAAVGKLAINLGMATDELSAWEGVAKRFGGTAEDMDGAFRGVTKILEDIKNTGGSDAITPLQKVGLDLAKFTDKATTGTQRMLMLADALKKLSPQDAQYFGAQAGFSESTINLMLRGSTVLSEDLKTQREIGVATRASAAAAAELQAKWEEIFQRVTGVGREIAVSLYPAIKAVLDLINDFLALAKQNMPITKAAVVALTAALTALAALKFVGIIGSIAAMTGGLGAAGAVAISVLGTLVAIAAAVVGGAAGWAIGTGINSLLSDDTKNTIGRTIAKGMAALGSTDAQSALDAEARGAAPAPASVRNPSATRNSAGLPLDAEARGAAPAPASVRNPSATRNSAGLPLDAAPAGAAGLFAGLEEQFVLPAGLLDSVWKQESSRGKKMRSKAGAKGHFQFMDATAAQYGLKNPDDLLESATAAARMYADLLRKYASNLPKALAAYNWGQGNVDRKGLNRAPNETLGYITSITSSMNAGARYGRAGAGASTSETNIGSIVVHTQATDARGIARDIGPALRQQTIATNADYGIE